MPLTELEIELEKEKIALQRDRQNSELEIQKRKISLEEKQNSWRSILFHFSPLVTAFAALIGGIIGTIVSSSSGEKIAETHAINSLRVEEIKVNGTIDLEKTKQNLREIEFQYDVVKRELEDSNKTDAERAAVLLFLVKAGILNSLNSRELEKMAFKQIEDPQINIIPKLSSNNTPFPYRFPCYTDVQFGNFDVSLQKEENGIFYYIASVYTTGKIPEGCALAPVVTDASGAPWLQTHGWIKNTGASGLAASGPIAISSSSTYPLKITLFVIDEKIARLALSTIPSGFFPNTSLQGYITVGMECLLSRDAPKVTCDG